MPTTMLQLSIKRRRKRLKWLPTIPRFKRQQLPTRMQFIHDARLADASFGLAGCRTAKRHSEHTKLQRSVKLLE